jgi:predicted O-linked N-acetylglucosamine transferase (SPINDLY family)
MSDAEVERQIRADGVDILVDLAVHTHGNRLAVFARKPAPVQMTYLGYAGTTGLSAVDYRITDARVDPVGSDLHSVERLARLPETFWCYQAPRTAPAVGRAPCVERGAVTFGSANILAKMTPAVLKCWAAVLVAVPTARLRIKARGVSDAPTRRRITAILEACGVEGGRVEFCEWGTLSEYLEFLAGLDVALDPFPFNGGTTTCHSLWMGVPVVTCAGRTSVSRVGASILGTIGLPELIAHSVESYVEIAARLAGDRQRIDGLRTSMRRRMSESPLMQGERFVNSLESVMRDCWRRWCGSDQ